MFSLLSAADEGLNLHVAGLPKWMAVKNIDHLSAKEKNRIVSPLQHCLFPFQSPLSWRQIFCRDCRIRAQRVICAN